MIDWERNRPLEQIINEGSLGEVEKPKVKTQLELDIDKFLHIAHNDIVVMSEDKFNTLMDALPHNSPAQIAGLKDNPNLILISNVSNIGIVKA